MVTRLGPGGGASAAVRWGRPARGAVVARVCRWPGCGGRRWRAAGARGLTTTVRSVSAAQRPRKLVPCSALTLAATGSGTAQASTSRSSSPAAVSAARVACWWSEWPVTPPRRTRPAARCLGAAPPRRRGRRARRRAPRRGGRRGRRAARGLEVARTPLARPRARDEGGVFEHLQVARHGRHRHREGSAELRDRRVALRQLGEDRPTGRVGERREHHAQLIGPGHHTPSLNDPVKRMGRPPEGRRAVSDGRQHASAGASDYFRGN
jgi:hypothetical protein